VSAQFERPVAGLLKAHGWTFELSGRIDQIITDKNKLELREIKSTRHALPDDPENLKTLYPHYFNQAAIYPLLLAKEPEHAGATLRTKLVFVNIEDGISQSIDLEQPEEVFTAQCARMRPFLEARIHARERCVSATFKPPFRELRDGQAEARNALLDSRVDTQHRIFQAPTGFGKTGIALEYALHLLKSGEVERIVYLTSKTSGQHQACKQLAAMLEGCPDPPLTLQLRNREDHHQGLATIPETLEDSQHLSQIVSEIPYQFRDGFLDLETIKHFALEKEVDPFEITRRAIPFADILVADYNYIFSPGVRGFLENTLGWQSKKTFLIVDEAHNLPSRGCMVWSQELTVKDIELLRDFLFFNNLSIPLQRDLDEFLACIEQPEPGRTLSHSELYALKDQVDRVKANILSTHLPWDELPDQTIEALNSILFVQRLWEYAELPLLIQKTTDKAITWQCLDASTELGHSLDSFFGTLCMSATIGQPDIAADSFGIGKHLANLQWIEAEAPWRKNGYKVAIDTRVDTRLKARERSYQMTAETVAAMAETAPGTVVAFFPSYRYAEAIRTYLETLFPYLRLTLQKRGLNFDQQESYLLSALNSSDVLLLILGSSFSEGIDVLGGRVSKAVVVGPALPEMSATQEALRKRFEDSMSPSEAFERAYIVPGMQKINQALGRLVRSPDHRAQVMLHGKRFQEPNYQKHLDPVFTQSTVFIKRKHELAEFFGDHYFNRKES
ncbi:MAG: helicase C-terminal domain-containing protein, partial [Verrucomicrobiota bacterium]